MLESIGVLPEDEPVYRELLSRTQAGSTTWRKRLDAKRPLSKPLC